MFFSRRILILISIENSDISITLLEELKYYHIQLYIMNPRFSNNFNIYGILKIYNTVLHATNGSESFNFEVFLCHYSSCKVYDLIITAHNFIVMLMFNQIAVENV